MSRHGDDRNVAAGALLALAKNGDVQPVIPAYQDYAAYSNAGGYTILRSCLSGARKAEDVRTIRLVFPICRGVRTYENSPRRTLSRSARSACRST